MATPFLNLQLPTVSVTLGPEWANEVNAAFETIDSHDHSSGKGAQVPTSGLNINADLDFNSFGALNLNLVSMDNRTSSPSGSTFASAISVFSGDLYFTNSSGVPIQLTAGGTIASLPGSAQIFETQDVSSDLIINAASTFVYLIVDTTAPRSITLPAASAVTSGRIYIIKDASGSANTNNITLLADGADLIDGSASVAIDSNLSTTMIVSDGLSNWYVS